MHNFMAIMSQLFWGVTIGALSAAFEALAKGAMGIVLIGGAGWYAHKWQAKRRLKKAMNSTKSAPDSTFDKGEA